jgi:hypothetical protein
MPMSIPSEQLEAMRRLPENWDGYGAAAPQGAVLDFAHVFVGFLEAALKTSRSDAPTLHVSPTRIGGILVEWDDSAMEHEVQINPDFCLSFLYLHKATGQITTRTFAQRLPAS